MDIPVKYTFSRGSGKFYTFIKKCFIIGYFWNLYIHEKYYKGTDSILYFPYVHNNDLKICPKIKIPYYYGLKADNIIFDELYELVWTKECKEYDPSLSIKINDVKIDVSSWLNL